MPQTAKPPQLCPRCHGMMFPTGDGGDFACFSCGHVLYAAMPSAPIAGEERKTFHAGSRLN